MLQITVLTAFLPFIAVTKSKVEAMLSKFNYLCIKEWYVHIHTEGDFILD